MLHDGSFELDVAQHRLRPLDVALARFMAERDNHASPSLLWLTALLSRQLADGHLCLDLDALRGNGGLTYRRPPAPTRP